MTKFKCSAFPSLVFCALATCCPSCEPCDMSEHTMHACRTVGDDGRKRRRNNFVIDSGATIHCINDKSLFTSFDPSRIINVVVANNQVITCEGAGTVVLPLTNDQGITRQVVLHNCVYSPHFGTNLISVRRLWKDNRISTRFGRRNYLKCKATGDKFEFNEAGYNITSAYSVRKADSIDMKTLHARFGHPSHERMKHLIAHSKGIPHISHHTPQHPDDCDACNAGGGKRFPFPSRKKHKYTYFGERISSDICGPFPKSVDGYKYALCFVDSATNYLDVFLLKSKAAHEVSDCFRKYLNTHKLHLSHGKQVRWHTDNGGEFTSHELDEFCEEFAVRRSFSVPYAPPQNSHAERMWGILLRPTRIMLAHAHVHESFWSYALLHAATLHNIMPSRKFPHRISPHECLNKTPPDVSKFRVWGCVTWWLVPDHELPSKVSPRSLPAVNLGFDPIRNGYIVYIPHRNRITSAYHVVFQEHKFLHFTEHGITNLPPVPKPPRKPKIRYDEPRDDPSGERGSDGSDHDGSDNDVPPRDQRETRVGTYGPNPDRVTRNTNPNYAEIVFDDVNMQAFSINPHEKMSDIITPDKYEQAIAGRFKERWIESMTKEIQDLLKHNTWELVSIDEVPKGKKITKSRWCYTIKYNRDGSIERFKSRFVACGYSQVKGDDYTHTFSATLRATSFRLLLAAAAGERLTLEHFDVTSAFTQADIDAEIYVQPPKGFETKDDDGNPKILKLRKALYGTKQASRMWQEKLAEHLVTKMGFTQSKHDPCMFVKRNGPNTCMVGVYVDDVIVGHNNEELLKWFTHKFTGEGGFRAKHLGKLSWFLGIAVDQSSDLTVTACQSKYTEKLLDKFIPSYKSSMRAHASPCNTDTFQKLRCAQDDIERDRVTQLPYRELVGSLLYLSTMTRPDVAYHMSVLCQFMHDPTVDCYNAALDLLLYLGHTRNRGITFSGKLEAPAELADQADFISSSSGLVAYSDSSWHKPNELGYNMFGYFVFVFGGPVAFASKRLKVVALSSAEAEYAAASYSCKEVMFVRNVCNDLGIPITGPTILAVDNQAAIKIVENKGVTARNKHFNDALHYVRHLYDHNVVRPVFVSTKAQMADGFTKALSNNWIKRVYGISDIPH